MAAQAVLQNVIDKLKAHLLDFVSATLVLLRQVGAVFSHLSFIVWFHMRKIWGQSASMDRDRKRRKAEIRFWLSLSVVILALLSTIMAFLVVHGFTSLVPTNELILQVYFVNAFLILVIAGIIFVQVFKILKARKKQLAGAGLHFRIGGLFSLITLFPAVVLAISANVSTERTLDHIFSSGVKLTVDDAQRVAIAYSNDVDNSMKSDLESIVKQLDEVGAVEIFREEQSKQSGVNFNVVFADIISRHSSISDAKIFRVEGATQSTNQITLKNPANIKLLASASSSDQNMTYTYGKADLSLDKINEGESTHWDISNSVVGAFKKINAYGDDTYLYIRRPINADAYRLLINVRNSRARFYNLQESRKSIGFSMMIMYVLLTLTLVTSSTWIGLTFANRLVKPIRQLIAAAQDVSHGNLNVRLEGSKGRDDMSRLRNTFQQMTLDLRNQRDDIMSANAELEERRRFIEAVLSGVSSGIIGLDTDGRITLVNPSAANLLEMNADNLIGRHLNDVVPEFNEAVQTSVARGGKASQSQVTLVREKGERNYAVQVTREEGEDIEYGVVVTFDDVTELNIAQRTSAWADVARRLAHEIKNPLTPIQLSAERIRRKYGDAITTDREIFDRCTDTIIRHVGDIGRMVDEFSSFARMPKPVFEAHDMREIVREAVILFQLSRSDIEYKLEIPREAVDVMCDRALLTQAITNLVKNASEAVEAYQQNQNNGQAHEKGRITVRLYGKDQRFFVEVTDNGCGLPKENRHRLTEPYVTTRQKGTGLGLAIVQRITEQHGGALELGDAPREEGYTHGARIRMNLPIILSAEVHTSSAANELTHTNGKDSSEHHGKEGINYGV